MFYVDIEDMEIFTYSENQTLARRLPHFNLKKVLLKSIRSKIRTKTPAVAVEKPRVDIQVRIKLLINSIKTIASASVKFLWLVPALLIAAMIPITVVNVFSYFEGFAKNISLDENDSWSQNILSNELSNFAMSSSTAFDYDDLSADEEINLSVTGASIKEPVTFTEYVVKKGDTIDGISRRYGLRSFSTLININNINNVRVIRSGQKLRIPSMDGMLHVVEKKETLTSIAERYHISVEDLLDVNDLASETLTVGMELFIPGATMDKFSLLKAMGELFLNPLKVKYRFTSPFSMRNNPVTGVYSHHTGVDFACPTGTPIYASLSGSVVFTGTSNVYGYYVIVKHYDGYQTLYAHMSKILCKKGDYVDQNTKIGLVGSTGQSTGPHLHFSVYKNGKLVDPMSLIKSK